MLSYSKWLALRPKRTAIEAAFHALGMPLTGWMNEVPTFKPGYEPDWNEIDKIVTTLDDRVVTIKPKPKPVVVEEKKAPKVEPKPKPKPKPPTVTKKATTTKKK